MKLRHLKEAPIGDINMMGNWDRNHSFRDQDRKLLNNPKAIRKYREKWAKTKHDFQMFFINLPGAGRHYHHGEITMDWFKEKFPKIYPELVQMNEYGTGVKEESINVFYTNNQGGDTVPLTSWIAAHRLSHALMRDQTAEHVRNEYLFEPLRRILKDDYGISGPPRRRYENPFNMGYPFHALLYAIGTFRSAREKNISANTNEIMHELFAQYLITGSIKFNPLPQSLQWRESRNKRHARLLNPDDAGIDHVSDTIEYGVEEILNAAVGRMWLV